MNTLRNELKRSYSQIPNELITDLSLCSGSLRVLLYLFTKPDNWKVYNADICKQLDISEQTLTKYWKILLASTWLKREVSMSEDGRLTGGYTYLIGNFTVSIHSTDSVNSIDHSNNKLINKQETIKPFSFSLSKKSKYDNLSAEYKSNLSLYAKEKDNCKELQAFIDYHTSKGSLFTNWSSAYNTWCRNAEKFNPTPKGNNVDGYTF